MTVDLKNDAPIVMRPPPWAPPVATATAALLCSWYFEGWRNAPGYWLLAGAVLILLVWLLYRAPVRFVVSRTHVQHLRGQRVVATYALADLERVTLGRQATVRFSQHRTVRLGRSWTNFQQAITVLHMAEDRKQVETDEEPRATGATRADVSLRHLTFPRCCVNCEDLDELTLPLKGIGGSFFLPQIDWVEIPLCLPCRLRRKRFGLRLVMVYCGLWMAATFVPVVVLVILPTFNWLFYCVASGMVAIQIAAAYFAASQLSRRLDSKLLGVRVLRLSTDAKTISLEFRDPEMAQQVRRRSSEAQHADRDIARRFLSN